MPYTSDISRNNPGCFLFLIDQSGSMMGALGGQPDLRKMDGAADAVNRILDAISQRCSQGMDIPTISTSESSRTVPTEQGAPSWKLPFPGPHPRVPS